MRHRDLEPRRDRPRARLAIAVVPLLLVLAGASAAAQDLVVYRDDTYDAGEVRACAGDRCVLDGREVKRDEILWIGLAQGEPPAMPEPRDPAREEVHLTNGEVVPGPFVGLSLGGVAVEGRSLERHEVAWIYLGAVAPPP